MNRRTLFKALCALPFVGKLLEREPEPRLLPPVDESRSRRYRWKELKLMTDADWESEFDQMNAHWPHLTEAEFDAPLPADHCLVEDRDLDFRAGNVKVHPFERHLMSERNEAFRKRQREQLRRSQ